MTDDSDDAGDDMTSSDVRTVLGTARRDQRWGLTELVEVQTMLGRTRFDLRNARPLNPDDDVEMSISCALGTVELLVPYGTRVQLDGTTYLGGSSSDVTESDPDGEPGMPISPTALPPLDITATVILGRVRIHTPDRPASNTWLCRLMERRRSRRVSKKTRAKVVAKPVPEISANPDPIPSVAPVMEAPVAPNVTMPETPAVPAVDVSGPPPQVAAAVDLATASPPVDAASPPVEDVPRFEPSEPDEDALGETDNWKVEAEAEAARGGWSLSLGDEAAPAEDDDDGMDGWKILPA